MSALDAKNLIAILPNPIERQLISATDAEQMREWLLGSANDAIDTKTALRDTTASACIRLISRTIASFPLHLFHRLPRGRELAERHPVEDLLQAPGGADVNAYNLKQALFAYTAGRGNCYARIMRTGSGVPGGLEPIDPDTIRPQRARSGQWVYVQNDGTELPPAEVLHLRTETSDPWGMEGLSPIERYAETLKDARAQRRFASKFWTRGANVTGTLQTEGALNPDARKDLKKEFSSLYSGEGEDAGKVAVLTHGLKFDPTKLISPADADWMAARKLSREDVATIWSVPPVLVTTLDGATYANLSEAIGWFLKTTLTPYLTAFEQEVKLKLLGKEASDYSVKFNVDSLLRSDTANRYKAHKDAIVAGWIAPNEIREKEDLDPIDGLDVPLRPLNMEPFDEEEDDDGEKDKRALPAPHQPSAPTPIYDVERGCFEVA